MPVECAIALPVAPGTGELIALQVAQARDPIVQVALEVGELRESRPVVAWASGSSQNVGLLCVCVCVCASSAPNIIFAVHWLFQKAVRSSNDIGHPAVDDGNVFL